MFSFSKNIIEPKILGGPDYKKQGCQNNHRSQQVYTYASYETVSGLRSSCKHKINTILTNVG